MCDVNTGKGDAANLEQDRSEERDEAAVPCLFCGTDQVVSMELDTGVWAVCCCGCNTIGPQARSRKRALALWNAPALRQVVP